MSLRNPPRNAAFLWRSIFSTLLAASPLTAFAQPTSSAVPQNSHLKSFGSGWECDYGYRESAGAGACTSIKVPANGHLTDYSTGQGWECDRGYRGANCTAIS